MSIEQPRLPCPRAEDCAAYVLGALPQDEHEVFVAHLERCRDCREELAGLAPVAASLAVAVEQLQAPTELKPRVLAVVHSEAGLRDRHTPEGVRAGSLRVRLEGHATIGWALAALVLAALVVVLALPGGGSSVRVVPAEVTVPRASATLRVSSGHAELVLAGMPQTSPGRVYEVWLKRAGGPLPTDALFTVSSSGRASVGVPGSTKGLTAVMVTAEPRGGTLVPTSAPVIVARLG